MAARRLNFFVIGAMKAGTTSLHYYLKEHPGLFLPIEKEIPFFAMDELYERGMDWYLDEFFSKAGTGQLLGTVSPPYMLNSKAAERIYRALPDVKLIALLRDPIDRAKSQYKMLVRAFGERRPFAEALSAGGQYVTAGEYGKILDHFLKFFPPEQLLVLFTEDLEVDPAAVLSRIYSFLGVDGRFVSASLERHNTSTGSRRRPLARFAANLVHTYSRPLHPFIRKLLPERYTRRFGKWSILYRSNAKASTASNVSLSREEERELAQRYLEDLCKIESIAGQPAPWRKRMEMLVHGD